MRLRNSTKRILLGLLIVLSLQQQAAAQTTDSVSVMPENRQSTAEPFSPKTGKEPEGSPETVKPNNKIIAAVCLFIITTTLLLYHVRSK